MAKNSNDPLLLGRFHCVILLLDMMAGGGFEGECVGFPPLLSVIPSCICSWMPLLLELSFEEERGAFSLTGYIFKNKTINMLSVSTYISHG